LDVDRSTHIWVYEGRIKIKKLQNSGVSANFPFPLMNIPLFEPVLWIRRSGSTAKNDFSYTIYSYYADFDASVQQAFLELTQRFF